MCRDFCIVSSDGEIIIIPAGYLVIIPLQRICSGRKNTTLAAFFIAPIVIFIGFLGYSLTITILTPLILEGSDTLLGSLPFMADPTIILGVVLAIYPVGQFFGAPVMGALSDLDR